MVSHFVVFLYLCVCADALHLQQPADSGIEDRRARQETTVPVRPIPPFAPFRGEVNATTVTSRAGSRVYFMLSIVPPHIFRLRVHAFVSRRIAQIIQSMRDQTYVPDGVVLVVPKQYHRFPGSTHIAEIQDKMASFISEGFLIVNYIDVDAGPLSKYLGHTLMHDDDIVIIGDDDVDYANTFIEDFVSVIRPTTKEEPRVFTGSIDSHVFVMGYSGVGCKAWQLRKLPSNSPDACFWADDVFITKYFDDNGMSKFLLKKTKPDNLRTKAQKNATSVNHYHTHHGTNVNWECVHALCD